ncbi:MAG: NAD-dependent epimerase/dehydratase family protein [Candidatus Micrarchaeia archaeon]
MGIFEGSRVFITGGAGFIGGNMAEELLSRNSEVTVYDNLSLPSINFVNKIGKLKNLKFVKGDLLNKEKLEAAMKEAEPEIVIHLSANADIRKGLQDTSLDLKEGTLATYNVLDAMRQSTPNSILFASSSVVYGKASIKPTPESYGPLKPISLYGAAKLAAEGLISSYESLFGIRGYIFRFANIVGNNQTHGVIVDFINKLKKDKSKLEVLGNGKQKKSYMDVDDCINAMLFIYEKEKKGITINLATDGQTEVEFIAKEVIRKMNLNAQIVYTGTEQGWPGDLADTWLSNALMKNFGVKLKYPTSNEALTHAIDILIEGRQQ